MLGAQALSRAGSRKILRAGMLLAAAAILSRARVMLDLTPFALALFAAGLTSGESAAALLAGCVLGALRFPLANVDLVLLSGCALVMLGALVLDKVAMPEEMLAPALAAAAVFLPGLLKTGLEVYATMLLLMAAVAASVAAAAFQALLNWRPRRERLPAEARAPAALLLFAALMGLWQVFPPGAYLLASAAVLLAPADMGAALGALGGMGLLAGGAHAIHAVSLCAGGAVSGLLAGRGRLWAAPGFVLVAGLAGLYAPEAFAGPLAPALAAAVYVALPEDWLRKLRERVLPPNDGARARREEMARALASLGEAFGELAAGIGNAAEDEGAVFSDLRERLCDGCSGYRECWAGEDDRAVRLLSRAISDAAVYGACEAAPDVMRVCRRGEHLPPLAAEEVHRLRRKRSEEGALPGALFHQAERILSDLATADRRPEARRQLHVRWGASAASMSPGVPSGDAHIVKVLPDGRTMLLLSDGMGSGEAARAESERAARLLWKFLEARVEPEAAFQAVNELMLLRAAGDMYATVDLCLIDPASKYADFLKLAASRSLIVRGGEVLTIEGGHLPLGVLEGVAPSTARVELRPGDLIVMGSDGVMDGASEGFLEQKVLENTTLPPGELAEKLLRAMEERGERRDDMTTLCARVVRSRASRGPPKRNT